MRTSSTFAIFFAMAAVFSTGAAALPVGVSWGDSVELVGEKLTPRCAHMRRVEVRAPSFPLAKESEHHLICRGLETLAGTRIDGAAFVFGDGKLRMIEARGGAAAAFGSGDESSHYMHFAIHDDGERWVDNDGDAVWFLSEAARHPNLFSWRHPLLDDSDSLPCYRSSAAIPPILDFTKTLDESKEAYLKECPLVHAEETRVFLPNKPAIQAQVNCFGYEYAGFPRKFEAIYGDGKLEVVWILTGKEEEARVRNALVAEFGAAETVNEKWETYAGGRVALRKDKPEVLLLSDDMVPHYIDELTAK